MVPGIPARAAAVETAASGVHHCFSQIGPGHGFHRADPAGAVVFDLTKSRRVETNDDAVGAFVGDEEVRAAAEDPKRRAVSIAALRKRGEGLDRVGANQQISPAANAVPGHRADGGIQNDIHVEIVEEAGEGGRRHQGIKARRNQV